MTTQKSLRFEDEDYIEEFQVKNGISNFSTAVNTIIREHKAQSFNAHLEYALDVLSDVCSKIEFREPNNKK